MCPWTYLQVAAAASVLVCVQAATLVQPEWGYYFDQDDQGPDTYSYGYDIEDPTTRNIQFKRERRLPNGTVTGSYGLVEADGNVQIVYYTADHRGYRVNIENSQRPDERHPSVDARWGPGWERPWHHLWYSNSRPSPLLDHAVNSLQTLGSPVEEQRTPPALQHSRGSFQNSRGSLQDIRAPLLDSRTALQDIEQEQGMMEDGEPDQSLNYPIFIIPPDQNNYST